MIPGSRSWSFLGSAWPLITYVLAAIEAWTLGLLKWMTVPLSLKRLTSSIAGMLFTPNLLRVFCSRLSSVVVVLWIAFFFRRTEPLPPVRTCAAIFSSFSLFIFVALYSTRQQE